MTDERVIRSIGFMAEGGVVIEYVTPAVDVAANGIVLNHSVLVPALDEYDTELTDLVTASQALLATVLAVFFVTPALDLPAVLDDDVPSPYDAPQDVARWKEGA